MKTYFYSSKTKCNKVININFQTIKKTINRKEPKYYQRTIKLTKKKNCNDNNNYDNEDDGDSFEIINIDVKEKVKQKKKFKIKKFDFFKEEKKIL